MFFEHGVPLSPPAIKQQRLQPAMWSTIKTRILASLNSPPAAPTQPQSTLQVVQPNSVASQPANAAARTHQQKQCEPTTEHQEIIQNTRCKPFWRIPQEISVQQMTLASCQLPRCDVLQTEASRAWAATERCCVSTNRNPTAFLNTYPSR